MSEPTFTVDEANALLPVLVPLLEALRRAQQTMEDLHDEVMTSVPTNGGGKAHRAYVDASDEAARATDAVSALGAVIRDPGEGLVDFPSARAGEEIFLCWRLGEDTVTWWHPTDTGFAGRQPL